MVKKRWCLAVGFIAFVGQQLQAADGVAGQEKKPSHGLMSEESFQQYLARYPMIEPHKAREHLQATRERIAAGMVTYGDAPAIFGMYRLMGIALASIIHQDAKKIYGDDVARTKEHFWQEAEIVALASSQAAIKVLEAEVLFLQTYIAADNRQMIRYQNLLLQLLVSVEQEVKVQKKRHCWCRWCG